MTAIRLIAVLMLVPAAAALLWRPRRRAPGRLWLGLLLLVNALLVAGGWLDVLIPGAFPIVVGAYVLSPLLLHRAVTRLHTPVPVSLRDTLLLVPAAVLFSMAITGMWGWALLALHGTAVVTLGMTVATVRRSPVWVRILFAVFVLHWAFSGAASLSAFSGWRAGDLFELASIATLLAFGLGAGMAGVRFVAARFPEVTTFRETPKPTVATETLTPEHTALCARLRCLFEDDAVHLDPDLTLETLALRATADARDVSRVLNSVLGGGYHDVVRRYRIDHAKALLLQDPDATILSVLHDAGFNSKSAFHRAFSEQVGMTPSDWRRMHAEGRPTS